VVLSYENGRRCHLPIDLDIHDPSDIDPRPSIGIKYGRLDVLHHEVNLSLMTSQKERVRVLD
jgi:hypothetical protein